MLSYNKKYSMSLWVFLLLRDIKRQYGLTYEELSDVERREGIVKLVFEHYPILHYYGNDGVIDILERDWNVTFDRP